MTIEKLARVAAAVGWRFEDLFQITPEERDTLDSLEEIVMGKSEK